MILRIRFILLIISLLIKYLILNKECMWNKIILILINLI